MPSVTRLVERPAYKQSEIVDSLLRQIIAGKLPPRSQIPSLNALAEQFKTTNNTVQLAIRRLREEEYIVTVPGKGAYVSEKPPHLTNFGIVFQQQPGSMPSVSSYLRAWHEETLRANETGPYRAMPFYVAEAPASWKQQQELMAAVENHRLSGLIFPNPPFLFRNTPVLESPDLPRVTIEYDAWPRAHCIQLASILSPMLDHLASRGRRRIAFITCDLTALDVEEYIRSTTDAVHAKGMSTRHHWIHASPMGGWASTCTELLFCAGQADRPDALVILDDNIVPAATTGLLAAGLRVPDDVEVVAHANFPHPTPSAVPAKRIGYNIRWMLNRAINIILQWRQGKEVPPSSPAPIVHDDEVSEVSSDDTANAHAEREVR